MIRVTGSYRTTAYGDETVKAFVPLPLPPKDPVLKIDARLDRLNLLAQAGLDRLAVAGEMVPSTDWFLYGFVRKEALISSQIEGTQATLMDIVTYEATRRARSPADAEEVCNYIDALRYARAELATPKGLPLCTRLLCHAHQRLMRGTRGADKQPGKIRVSQNWIGGTRPGNARFVPPPADAVPQALTALERWIHSQDKLPPLIRAGLAHVQFETIHPFLDGNGRIGRLLITLLTEHWKLLPAPLLYVSLAFNRRRAEYYQRLSAVRTAGDWEGWTAYFLECVQESADDGVHAAKRIFAMLNHDRQKVLGHKATTIPAVQLYDLLPRHPVITLPLALKLLKTTKPTAGKAIDALRKTGILHETTGRERDRVYAYRSYIKVLAEGTGGTDEKTLTKN